MKFKYINLNLWWGGRLMDEIIKFINYEDPDIFVCQEAINGKGKRIPVNLRTVEIFKQKFSFGYFAFSPAFSVVTDNGKLDVGNLVCSKFPVIKTETVFFDFPYQERKYGIVLTEPDPDQVKDFINTPRNLQQTVIKLNSQLLNVFNTQGIWDKHGLDNPRRLNMVEKIINKTTGKKNMILSGDFNVNEGTQTIKNLQNHFRSIFKEELNTSFNMKFKSDPGYASAVVDMIFVSSEFSVIDHYCPDVNVSDHLPLVTILDLSEVD